jgi:hypothetical protein
MIQHILAYLNRNANYATEDKGLITIYHGLVPGMCIYPYTNKWWKQGDEFPYPTVRIHSDAIPAVGLPLDIWQVRTDFNRALVIPDTMVYSLKYRVDTGMYELPTDELGYIDLTSEEEMLANWHEGRDRVRKPRKKRK